MLSPQSPHFVIRAKRGWQVIPVQELLEFRDLLGTLATRDIKLRYRQTAVGVIWVVLQPLIGAGLFSFVFGAVAKLPTGNPNIPYFAFSYAGLLCWNLFVQVFQKSSDSMVGNAHLVSKIYFPRLILPLSTVYGVLLDFAVASILMAVLMAMYNIVPHVGLLLLPVIALLTLLLALGFGLWAAALNVSYRDVRYVVPVLTNFLLWASPVAYAAAAVPERVRGVINLNPLTGLLEAFRWSILGTNPPSWSTVAYSATFSVVIFVAGAFLFQKKEQSFADVI